MTTLATDSQPVCENCQTVLVGIYCHHCGQSSHNPLKHTGHAIEDVFESFWHLDGRIFSTLRDLWVPGRIARRYLDGQRVRYMPPLRLFVILSLFTFFLAKLLVPNVEIIGNPASEEHFSQLTTPDEVISERDRLLMELTLKNRTPSEDNLAAPALELVRSKIEETSSNRLAELEAQPRPADPSATYSVPLTVNGKNWHPQENPFHFNSLPGWANTHLNERLARLQANIQGGEDKVEYIAKAFLSALPAAMFALIPVFALVLWLFYANRATTYLEHLVVALYSQAWLMLVMTILMLSDALTSYMGIGLLSSANSVFSFILWLAIPIYLLVMQQRVYGGNIMLTMLRATGIASIYLILLGAALVYAILAGITA